MKDLRACKAYRLVQNLVAEGEHENQDFKVTVNDPRKIARTVSAFANHSGGRLLIGVNDNGVPRGVRNEEDIYVVEAAAGMYCDPPCTPQFTAYRAEGGLTVIRADISAAERRPVVVLEADGTRRAYYRVADENIAAHPLMVRAWHAKDDPSRNIVFDLTTDRTRVLDALAGEPMTPDDLALRVGLSRRTFEQVAVDLAVMDLVEFRFIDRRFHLALTDTPST